MIVAVGQQLKHRFRVKAAAMLSSIEGGLDRMMMAWLLLVGLASSLRIAASPVLVPGIQTFAPYLLLILAPFASMVLALRWFSDGDRQPQPEIRLARIGRWRDLPRAEAKRHRLYGAGGIMVSLLVGMILNVPLRALEYLAAVPAIGGLAPTWLSVLHAMMTLDVVLLTSLYTVAFVAALRRAPVFPRLLLFVWLLDVTMQLTTAHMVAATPGLPYSVAEGLQGLLQGNINKALISVAVWLPYLLLSKRVNVTYRHRVRA